MDTEPRPKAGDPPAMNLSEQARHARAFARSARSYGRDHDVRLFEQLAVMSEEATVLRSEVARLKAELADATARAERAEGEWDAVIGLIIDSWWDDGYVVRLPYREDHYGGEYRLLSHGEFIHWFETHGFAVDAVRRAAAERGRPRID